MVVRDCWKLLGKGEGGISTERTDVFRRGRFKPGHMILETKEGSGERNRGGD